MVDWQTVPSSEGLRRFTYRKQYQNKQNAIKRKVRNETIQATAIGCILGIVIAAFVWVLIL